MSVTFEDIRHDGGSHRVEVEIEGDQCVIRFGASFTLRVNEANLNTLRVLCSIQRETSWPSSAEIRAVFVLPSLGLGKPLTRKSISTKRSTLKTR